MIEEKGISGLVRVPNSAWGYGDMNSQEDFLEKVITE